MLSRRGADVGEGINGLRKAVAAKRVNAILDPLTKGIFHDDDWAAVRRIWAALDSAGIAYILLDTKYEANAYGTPTAKTWRFEVPFTTDRGASATLYGRIVAAGAGSVATPLSAYDLVAYVN